MDIKQPLILGSGEPPLRRQPRERLLESYLVGVLAGNPKADSLVRHDEARPVEATDLLQFLDQVVI